MVLVAPGPALVRTVVGASLALLAVLGALAARVGGAPVLRGTLRVLFWGALAMGITAAAGALFGATA
jgi:VIT1/CCC1 family predicted Fe2+/Mn2+ transporter